jgi:predicted Zn finger-like uncharacterized protein
MSLVTRCPACGTLFKVVADQLRISEGWVRCGHCAEVFDATADLRDDSDLEPSAPAPKPAPANLPADDPVPSSGFAPSSVHSEVDDSFIDEDLPDPREIEEQARVLREHPLDQPFELRRADVSYLPDESADVIGPHGYSRPTPLEPEPANPAELADSADPELHELGFVRQARRKEFWRRPAVRAALVLLLVVLAATLVGQAAYQDRDRLAASSPALRPWLARLCDAMRCRLGPPLQIDAVAIETSTFNKLREGAYRLNVTLKNQAPNEVAMPSLELTLTDSQDQPVVRRVLQPDEFAPGRSAMPPRADWSTSVALAVNANAGASRIAGYRLLAFYP